MISQNSNAPLYSGYIGKRYLASANIKELGEALNETFIESNINIVASAVSPDNYDKFLRTIRENRTGQASLSCLPDEIEADALILCHISETDIEYDLVPGLEGENKGVSDMTFALRTLLPDIFVDISSTPGNRTDEQITASQHNMSRLAHVAFTAVLIVGFAYAVLAYQLGIMSPILTLACLLLVSLMEKDWIDKLIIERRDGLEAILPKSIQDVDESRFAKFVGERSITKYSISIANKAKWSKIFPLLALAMFILSVVTTLPEFSSLSHNLSLPFGMFGATGHSSIW